MKNICNNTTKTNTIDKTYEEGAGNNQQNYPKIQQFQFWIQDKSKKAQIQETDNIIENKRASFESENKPKENFCEFSDKPEEIKKFEMENFHFKRFKVEGPACPYPPAGGQNSVLDGANSISSSSRQSLLLLSSNSSSLLNSNNPDCYENNNYNPSLEKRQSFISTETESIQAFSTNTSPDMIGQRNNKENINEFIADNNMFPELQNILTNSQSLINSSTKKRENKVNEKFVCKGCHIKYNKLKKDNFCHNCYKIIEAVESFVTANNGSFNFNEVETTIELCCQRYHHWTVEFKTKQQNIYFKQSYLRVKKWCKTCRRSERDQRKEYYRRMEEEKQREFERVQRQLFEEAKEKPNNEDDDCQIDDMQRNFLNYVVADECEEIEITTQMMFEVVNYIINVPEETIRQFLQALSIGINRLNSENIARDRRMRAFRRIARIVHPDKNPHLLAKEAFQKLLGSSSSLRSSSSQSLSSSSQRGFNCGFLYVAEEDKYFGQPHFVVVA